MSSRLRDCGYGNRSSEGSRKMRTGLDVLCESCESHSRFARLALAWRRAAVAVAVVGAGASVTLPAAQAKAAPRLTNAGGTIGEANLNGTVVNQSFVTGANVPFGIAVDSQHIYWANQGSGTIGEANLNSTEANQSFIAGASFPVGVAVDSQHIYWTNAANRTTGAGGS